jgi:transcriptional regulator with XRE-family HTH domain
MTLPRDLGERLRQLRIARGLTLHAVQDATGGEFKAASLGAYERGQRALTVQRLDRLASVYGVDLGTVLIGAEHLDLVGEEDRERAHLAQHEAALAGLRRFVAWVHSRRRTPSPGPMRLRASDAELIGAMFAVSPDATQQLVLEIDAQVREPEGAATPG